MDIFIISVSLIYSLYTKKTKGTFIKSLKKRYEKSKKGLNMTVDLTHSTHCQKTPVSNSGSFKNKKMKITLCYMTPLFNSRIFDHLYCSYTGRGRLVHQTKNKQILKHLIIFFKVFNLKMRVVAQEMMQCTANTFLGS